MEKMDIIFAIFYISACISFISIVIYILSLGYALPIITVP